jgi:flavin reductase (DIM6/NTAB) family NADH-FMN oxidoreductase RutF
MPTHERQLAAALGRVPSGLFVLTLSRQGVETGMLASWVQQCSFEPPQVSVAVKPDRPVNAHLTDGATFALNVLGEGQTDLLKHFGRGFAPGEPAFEGVALERAGDGTPILTDALAHLECQVTGRSPAGDHDLVIARVTGGRLHGEGKPAVHVRKSGLHY